MASRTLTPYDIAEISTFEARTGRRGRGAIAAGTPTARWRAGGHAGVGSKLGCWLLAAGCWLLVAVLAGADAAAASSAWMVESIHLF
jgi:hypothetical protein